LAWQAGTLSYGETYGEHPPDVPVQVQAEREANWRRVFVLYTTLYRSSAPAMVAGGPTAP
jgi:hypothetical protein